MKLFFLLPMFCLLFCACSQNNVVQPENPSSTEVITIDTLERMSGVSLEMPANPLDGDRMNGLVDFGAKWVSLIPYGYTDRGEAKVNYFHDGRWWGESLNGTAKCIEYAQQRGLKTLLKPHVWVVGQGWPGDFDLEEESDWEIWESSYRAYILDCAKLADSMNVDAFCIGTEYRKAVVKRGEFWKKLIKEVREIYSGPLTYAANWDNYENVTFWDQLDFIGIDAYFPLSKKKRPTLDELTSGWKKTAKELKAFSEKWDRKIAFTEYGFKSVDYMYGGEKNEGELQPNMKNQETGYSAFFATVWKEEWMLGGFLWKWHFYDGAGGEKNTRYTPQNKPAQKIIESVYRATLNPN